jgi:hypothetical protein
MSPRRIRLYVRVVLYGTLALVALAVWQMRPGEKVILTGKTTQGEHFDLQARDDGDVDAFQTYFVARCADGEKLDMSWMPADGQPVGFERDGDRIHVREEWRRELEDGATEHGSMTLDGRVGEGGRLVTGVMDAETTFERDGYAPNECRVHDVGFRAAPVGG